MSSSVNKAEASMPTSRTRQEQEFYRFLFAFAEYWKTTSISAKSKRMLLREPQVRLFCKREDHGCTQHFTVFNIWQLCKDRLAFQWNEICGVSGSETNIDGILISFYSFSTLSFTGCFPSMFSDDFKTLKAQLTLTLPRRLQRRDRAVRARTVHRLSDFGRAFEAKAGKLANYHCQRSWKCSGQCVPLQKLQKKSPCTQLVMLLAWGQTLFELCICLY